MLKGIKTAASLRLMTSAIYVLSVALIDIGAIRSAFVGVMASLVPELYQAWKLSKTDNELNPQKWLGLVYRSLVTKWLMAIMVFSIVFVVSSRWDYGVLFLGYLLVQVSGILTPILFKGLK